MKKLLLAAVLVAGAIGAVAASGGCTLVNCRYFNQTHPPGKGHVTTCTLVKCANFQQYHVGESDHVFQ